LPAHALGLSLAQGEAQPKAFVTQSSANRQSASSHAIPFHNDEALTDIGFGQRGKLLAQAVHDVPKGMSTRNLT
jgi:hypothetical protein